MQLVHHGLNVRAVLVGVPVDHRQPLVSADSLHGGQVQAGLNKMGDCDVGRGMPNTQSGTSPAAVATGASPCVMAARLRQLRDKFGVTDIDIDPEDWRSEEHTSELQSL